MTKLSALLRAIDLSRDTLRQVWVMQRGGIIFVNFHLRPHARLLAVINALTDRPS